MQCISTRINGIINITKSFVFKTNSIKRRRLFDAPDYPPGYLPGYRKPYRISVYQYLP